MKKKDDDWIEGAEKSIKRRGTEGKCTPITKPGCTGRAETLAKTFKNMAKKRDDSIESEEEKKKSTNEETDEGAALEAAEKESKKKPKKKKKSDPSDPVEKAMGKAKKGHPGGIEHFRKKHKVAQKAALKQHHADLARDEQLTQDSIEYKRIGNIIADALGYRVDEAIPLLPAAKFVGTAVASELVGSAAKKALKKKKKPVEVEESKLSFVKPLVKKAGKGLKKIAQDPTVQAAALETGASLASASAAKKRKEAKEGPQLAHTEFKNTYLRTLMEGWLKGSRRNPTTRGGSWTPEITPSNPRRPQPKKKAPVKKEKAASKKSGKRPEGRGHGTPNPIQPSRT